MSNKADILAKLRRLAAPDSGATEGERRAALKAIKRITESADELTEDDLNEAIARLNDTFDKLGEAIAMVGAALNSSFERKELHGK